MAAGRHEPAGGPADEIATVAEQGRMYDHLRQALEAIHFLYGTKAGPLMHAVRQLIRAGGADGPARCGRCTASPGNSCGPPNTSRRSTTRRGERMPARRGLWLLTPKGVGDDSPGVS